MLSDIIIDLTNYRPFVMVCIKKKSGIPFRLRKQNIATIIFITVLTQRSIRKNHFPTSFHTRTITHLCIDHLQQEGDGGYYQRPSDKDKKLSWWPFRYLISKVMNLSTQLVSQYLKAEYYLNAMHSFSGPRRCSGNAYRTTDHTSFFRDFH